MTSTSIPHPVPYQGSKRRLADSILALCPWQPRTLVEPFAGSAAVTLAAAFRGMADGYLIGDVLVPLANLWVRIIENPVETADSYQALWTAQEADSLAHFAAVRERFNRTGDPIDFLYLAARCVKNAVRFNPRGDFNQSADKRRRGTRPHTMRRNMIGASRLLSGRTSVKAASYQELFQGAGREDLIYLDPPYQGVSAGRDRRYFKQLVVDEFNGELDQLNSRGIPYLLSYDGSCGEREYGVAPPKELDLARVLISTGRSSQSTLLGRSEVTMESVYVSPAARHKGALTPARIDLTPDRDRQAGLPL